MGCSNYKATFQTFLVDVVYFYFFFSLCLFLVFFVVVVVVVLVLNVFANLDNNM